jgi:uncharacterized alkaline shock family protein YloU
MPEIINALFGRAKNDTADSGEDVAASATAQTDSTQSDSADVVVTDETGGTKAIEVAPTETATVEPAGDATTTEDVAEGAETAPSADGAVESIEAESTGPNPADSDPENSDHADDQADDEPLAEATIETAAEESGEAATDEDLTQEAATAVPDEDGESAEDIEPAAVEAEDAPVATETDADDVEQTEPVVEPATAETRPAAGTRGNITVGDGGVAKVVNIVAGKIDGVHSLDDEGISVEVNDDIATIKVSLVIEYGHAIKPLAEQIRIDVIEGVEQFLGLDVAAVDVHVSDIHPPTAA